MGRSLFLRFFFRNFVSSYPCAVAVVHLLLYAPLSSEYSSLALTAWLTAGNGGEDKNMNITINDNSNNTNSNNIGITIDFSKIKTYGELKKALPSTGTRRVPGINQLRSKAVLLLRKESASGTIEIYDNGFFVFEECGRPTVYGVDRCERPETYSYYGRKEAGMETQDFSEYPWELILESAGSARLDHNSESREEYMAEYSLDAPESENNIAFSVKPEHEIREEEEEEAERRGAKVKQMKYALGKLTEKQRTIMMMDRVEKLTQEQIAERMGISRRTLREHLEAIEKKLNKYTANTRH